MTNLASGTRTWTLTSASMLTLVLCGCAVGPDFKRPEPPSVTSYASATEQSASGELSQRLVVGGDTSVEWWKSFQSDEINSLVEQAVRNNKTLAAANASVAQARELVAAQMGGKYPHVDLTASTGRQKYGAQFLGPFPSPPPFSYVAIGANVNYAVDYTGGLSRSIEQQRALAEVQQQQLQATYLTLTGEVVRQAIGIAFARAQLQTVQELLDEDRRNVDLVKAAFEAGAVTKVDVLSAESQLANDETVLPPLRQQLSTARHALAILAGQQPSLWAPPDIDLARLTLPKEIPASVPSELARRRPDILSAEANLHAATAAVGVATSELYPRIMLSGSAGFGALEPSSLFESSSAVWSLIGGITAPLFDGGTLRAKRRATLHALDASAARYQQTVLQAFGQVADALESLNHDAESLAAQSHALNSSQESLNLTRESFKEGNIGVLQVLDAERFYQQARIGYVRAQVQQYFDTTQLYLALGGSPLSESK